MIGQKPEYLFHREFLAHQHRGDDSAEPCGARWGRMLWAKGYTEPSALMLSRPSPLSIAMTRVRSSEMRSNTGAARMVAAEVPATLSRMNRRDFEADDVEWAAKLMERRRQVCAGYSPMFWRPAAGVTGLHAGFLSCLAANPANVCLRAEHGFVVGQLRQAECFVDDFAVDETGIWGDDGRDLLDELWARVANDTPTTMRVVTARADRDKVAMLTAAGLILAEQWWVKPLESTAASDTASGRVTGPGFSGLLGPAPPV